MHIDDIVKVNEGNGTVPVCLTLSVEEITAGDFIIMLWTENGTGAKEY